MEAPGRDPGDGPLVPRDPSRLRISDADRHAVAETLRHAAGEGRLDLDELDERLEAAYAAKTYGDLVPITADLPSASTPRTIAMPPTQHRPLPVAGPSYSSSFSVMGDCSRRGPWQVPDSHYAFSLMGSVTLDLREARFAARETTIDAYAVMAGIDVIVNAGTQVVVSGVGLMGDFGESRSRVTPAITPDSPIVRVRGLALMGGVRIKRKEMPGEAPRFLRRR